MGCTNGSCLNSPNTKISSYGFSKGRSEEIKALRKQKLTQEESLFLDYHERAKKDKVVKLSNLTLSSDIYFELLNAISKNTVIEELILSDIRFEGCVEAITQLYHAIKTKNSIEELRLEYLNNIGHKKGKGLYNLTKELQLKRIIFKELEFIEEDSDYIGMLIAKNNVHLEYFQLENVFFGKKLNYVLDGINVNNSIKELVLSKLGLNKDNFDFLISALVSNTSLILLDVSDNPIKDGTEAFKKYTLNDLEILKMNNCDIESLDFHSLCEGINGKTKRIKFIELNNNQISNAAPTIKGLELLFKENKSLERIALYNNPIKRSDFAEYMKDKDYSKIAC